MIADKDLQEWRDEVDNEIRKHMEGLKHRIANDTMDSTDPDFIAKTVSRTELCGKINELESVSITLGQIIRGRRL